jgi:hypothetical protein
LPVGSKPKLQGSLIVLSSDFCFSRVFPTALRSLCIVPCDVGGRIGGSNERLVNLTHAKARYSEGLRSQEVVGGS